MINKLKRCREDIKCMLERRATILRKKELEEVGFKERFEIHIISQQLI